MTKLIKKTSQFGTDFYFEGDVDNAKQIITVFRKVVPSDWDYDRACRTIEKMADMFEKCNCLSNFAIPKNLKNGLGTLIEALTKDCHYIEHGPETEPEDDNVIIKVLVPLGEGFLGEHYEIVGYTKKKAREVGLIK